MILNDIDYCMYSSHPNFYDSCGGGCFSPVTFAAKTAGSSPDEPTYLEAMSGDEAEQYWDACLEEVLNMEKRKVWEVVDRSAAEAAGEKVVPSTWAFKRKRTPSGIIKKYKSRLCIRGDIQKKHNANKELEKQEEVFAPVIQWSTVRLVLILTVILDIQTCHIDFSNAFTQAELTTPAFIELPKGFLPLEGTRANKVLKLKRNLYGSCFGPALWYKKLRVGLEARGFKPSERDPCLFLSPDIMVMIYVDDVVFVSRSTKKIDAIIKSFVDEGDCYEWEMTKEGDLKEFLGIDIHHNDKGHWKLTQTGLIKKVLEAAGMEDCNTKPTPATTALGKDANGADREETWGYASVVGMLMYLANNSRPDIAFAVHQCARFNHSPKRLHENAIKRILRYLKGTMHEGLILQPDAALSIDCYVDADFCGLWGTESSNEITSAKSRTGFVITFASCPLLWVSKLQTEVALSTTEAEFIALSQAMRELIPICNLATELFGAIRFQKGLEFRTHSTVFEDNNGALTLATIPKMTPRSKHIAVKYWFFRDHVKRGTSKIVKVDTKEQKADILTKALGEDAFKSIRKLLCGW